MSKIERALKAVNQHPSPQQTLIDYVDFTHIDMDPKVRHALAVGDIFLNQGEALCCGWIIRSKNRHHMAACKCGKAFIDGGSWYIRTGGDVKLHTVFYTKKHKEPKNAED